MLGYTTSTNFQVQMTLNDLDSSSIQLLVIVIDFYDSTT